MSAELLDRAAILATIVRGATLGQPEPTDHSAFRVYVTRQDADTLEDVVSALRASLVGAEPTCVFCQGPVSGHGPTACQLHDGRWACSEECWEHAARMWDTGAELAGERASRMDCYCWGYLEGQSRKDKARPNEDRQAEAEAAWERDRQFLDAHQWPPPTRSEVPEEVERALTRLVVRASRDVARTQASIREIGEDATLLRATLTAHTRGEVSE